MKKRLAALLSVIVLMTSFTVYAEEGGEENADELAHYLLSKAYVSLDSGDIGLAQEAVQTTTSSVMIASLTNLQEYKDKYEALKLEDPETIISTYTSLTDWLDSSPDEFIVELLEQDSPPRVVQDLIIQSYRDTLQPEITSFYNTMQPTELEEKVTTIPEEFVKSNIGYLIQSTLQLKESAELALGNLQSGIITVASARATINSLPNGTFKDTLLTNLETLLPGLPADPTNESVLVLLNDTLAEPTQNKVTTLGTEINKLGDLSLLESVNVAYNVLNAKNQMDTFLSYKDFSSAKTSLTNILKLIDDCTFTINKDLIKQKHTTVFEDKVIEQMTSLLTSIQTNFYEYEISQYRTLDAFLSTSREPQLATVLAYKTEAERLVAYAEEYKTNISEARSYITTNITNGQYRQSLLTRLDAISSTTPVQTKSAMEKEIRDAVKARSKARFKEAIDVYLDNYSTSDSELEAYISIFDKSKDSYIEDMFELLDFLDETTLKDSEIDDAQELIDDMPKKAMEYFQEELDEIISESTTEGTSSDRITIKRNDLTSTGKSIYDTLERFANKNKNKAQKAEVIELINQLEYNSSLTELDRIIRSFNTIIARDISNRNIRLFFETLYK